MPSLNRDTAPDTTSVTLPAREAQVIAEADVLVVGGGPAGLGAAIGAADAGANVVLAERFGFLGGSATAALVMPLMSYHTQRPSARQAGSATLFPTDHGLGKPVIAGVLTRLVDKLVERHGAIAPTPETGYVVPFDPEAFKSVALGLLDAAGVRYLLHSLASGVLGGSIVEGVVFRNQVWPHRHTRTNSGGLHRRCRHRLPCRRTAHVWPRARRLNRPNDPDVPDDRLQSRALPRLRQYASGPVVRGPRSLGPHPRGDTSRRPGNAARGHPPFRNSSPG